MLLSVPSDVTASQLAITGASLIGYTNTVSGVLDVRMVATGQQAWGAANNNSVNLSGQLSSLSGQAEGIYVHRTGTELISGLKTFFSTVTSSGSIDIYTGTSRGYRYGNQILLLTRESNGTTLCLGVNGAGNPDNSAATNGIYIGAATAAAIKAGSDNVIIGNSAASQLRTGIGNIAVGSSSLGLFLSGDNNCSIGNSCSVSLRTGFSNIIIGYNAGGSNFTSGDNNICIGSNAQLGSGRQQLNIGSLIYGQGVSLGGIQGKSISISGGLNLPKMIAASPGDVGMDVPAGAVLIGAATNSVTVTNNLVTTSSLIFTTVNTNDVTLTYTRAIPSNGSFQILGNTTATANVQVSFLVLN